MAGGLRDRQLASLTKMLTLSGTDSIFGGEDSSDQWKVLIYDSECGDIIAPLMNISALRQKGVTLHMLVSQFLPRVLVQPISCPLLPRPACHAFALFLAVAYGPGACS